jgi:hypothetical protein
MVNIPTPLSDEFYSAINDVYLLRSLGVALGEVVTLPLGGVPGAIIGTLTAPVTLPVALVAGGLYHVAGRKRPIVTPKFLAGSTSKENAYASMGAVAGNIGSQFLPPVVGAYSEPLFTAGGMMLGKNMA